MPAMVSAPRLQQCTCRSAYNAIIIAGMARSYSCNVRNSIPAKDVVDSLICALRSPLALRVSPGFSPGSLLANPKDWGGTKAVAQDNGLWRKV